MAAPTALLKMGHEDGEAAVARGCQMTGVGNCLSTTASLSLEDIILFHFLSGFFVG